MNQDFSGCRKKCTSRGAHSLVWGECEQAVEPEPSISILRHRTGVDGGASITVDSYTLTELAGLIEPALREANIRLGPNALDALKRGEEVNLSGGEHFSLALAAASALVNRNDGDA